MQQVIDAFNNRPLVHVKDRNFLINPLTDHMPTTSFELVDDTIKSLAQLTDYSKASKLIGEEDRGGFLVALMAYHLHLPFGMVKWNPNGFEGQISVEFRNAYTGGTMFLNGCEKGDKVILVEDMVDSGGSIVAMIELCKKAGVEIVDIVVIAEKEEYKGIERIKRETGRDVKLLLKFSSKGKTSKVTWINDKIK
jgi:adenine/guanine phosphoribosyltransferase-like PRPP-binding protein